GLVGDHLEVVAGHELVAFAFPVELQVQRFGGRGRGRERADREDGGERRAERPDRSHASPLSREWSNGRRRPFEQPPPPAERAYPSWEAAVETAGGSGGGRGPDAIREDRREAGTVSLGAAEQGGVELCTLVEPVDVGLPGEADPAVHLDR